MSGCKICMDFTRAPQAHVEALRQFSTPNIDDCLHRTAALSSSIRAMNTAPLYGTAFTVRVAPGDNLLLHEAMELAEPGDVIMIDAGGYTDKAIFGELMSTYCKIRGIRGIVVDGAIRDSGAIARMEDFSVYAKATTPNGPAKNGPGEIGTVISVGGITVCPGDIVIGDSDGVVVISKEAAEATAAAAAAVVKKEAETMRIMLEEGIHAHGFVKPALEKLGCIGMEFVK